MSTELMTRAVLKKLVFLSNATKLSDFIPEPEIGLPADTRMSYMSYHVMSCHKYMSHMSHMSFTCKICQIVLACRGVAIVVV